MRILLLGEFSGFYHVLKEGLEAHGHDVTLASNGDGWKQFPADINLGMRSDSVLEMIAYRWRLLDLPKICKSFEVVQFINPFEVFPRKCFPLLAGFRRLRHESKRLFMSAAGCDAFFWTTGQRAMRYGPFKDSLSFDHNQFGRYLMSASAMRINREVADITDGILPVMYEYAVSYRSHHKCLPTIPLPVNTDKIQFKELRLDRKLRVFHGLSRPGFKGTRHIQQAFSQLQAKYPNDLECIIAGRLPYDEYMKVLADSHLVIDQVNSYSCGMNAVIALAMGKIVIGGAEQEGLAELGISETPVVNVLPSSSSVLQAIERILDHRAKLQELSAHSRQFAERVHDYKRIASRYLETWLKVAPRPQPN